MITSIKELHTTITPADAGSYYNYLICKVRSGRRDRYDLYRIGDKYVGGRRGWISDTFTRLGCELPLAHCRRILREAEPHGTQVVQHKASARKKAK